MEVMIKETKIVIIDANKILLDFNDKYFIESPLSRGIIIYITIPLYTKEVNTFGSIFTN